jgi:hypothetical protein
MLFKTFVFFAFSLFIGHHIAAQYPVFDKLSLSFEGKAKREFFEKLDHNPESKPYLYPVSIVPGGSLLLTYEFKKHLLFQTGYGYEEFYSHWDITPKGYAGSQFLTGGHIIPLRLQYELPLVRMYKQHLSFVPSIGYLWTIQSLHFSFGEGITTEQLPQGWTLKHYFRSGEEYNLSRFFGAWEARGQFNFPFSKTLSLFLGGGYALGTRPIGYARIAFTHNGQPTEEVLNESRGTHYYLHVGFRFHLGHLLADY